MKFTVRQQALIDLIQASDTKFVSSVLSPGRESIDPMGYFIPKPYVDCDGRTVESLIRRGVLVSIGDNDYGVLQ